MEAISALDVRGFNVEGVLGRGGAAVVFAATHERKPVAVKVVVPAGKGPFNDVLAITAPMAATTSTMRWRAVRPRCCGSPQAMQARAAGRCPIWLCPVWPAAPAASLIWSTADPLPRCA